MKKTILTTAFALAVLFVDAQLKTYSTGKTYMGGTTTTPLSTLSVGGAGNSLFSIYGYNSTTTLNSANGIRGEIATPTADGIALYATTGIITPGINSTSVGVAGAAYRTTGAEGGFAYGVYGYAGNASDGRNFGVYGLLLGTKNGAGIVGSDSSSLTPNIPGKYAGYFWGDIRTTNDSPIKPNSGSWTGASDVRLKTDITSFKDGMNVIRQINPIKYKFNGIGNLPTNKYYFGVKAQDLQNIAPYTVSTIPMIVKQAEVGTFNVIKNLSADSSGEQKAIIEALSFNYDALIYVMINALKEQDSALISLRNAIPLAKKSSENNDSLKQEIENLKTLVNQCCTANPTQTSNSTGDNSKGNIQVELANKNNVVLYQNEPNPFSNQTIIRYFVPENITSAFVVFHDEFGREVNKVKVTEKGFGKIEAATENLASGMYSYSIVVDGKTMDTKKMMKSK